MHGQLSEKEKEATMEKFKNEDDRENLTIAGEDVQSCDDFGQVKICDNGLLPAGVPLAVDGSIRSDQIHLPQLLGSLHQLRQILLSHQVASVIIAKLPVVQSSNYESKTKSLNNNKTNKKKKKKEKE